ncbi:DUF3488 and transglutaminase-like domain-containing protein [Luteimonas sp. FCS-9]|uniref:transglutaminase TgpA family protein n=1 Tax=Luteimonas sp. FCS-9 TaxID=1547516 RepID=UPI00063E7759|nr:DUF3488 and transglutaminase-like domain-containing protein [Luteimonas sp. FCS-9]KLJ01298.1 membrane protein [Luteimonas sp. FCS-9]
MTARSGHPLDVAGRRRVLLAAAVCLLPLLLQLPPTVAIVVAAVGALVVSVSGRRMLPGWLRGGAALALLAWVLAQAGGAIGRDTGCALLAAMLAVKPSELRTLRDARSLLGFALFAPFATFLLDQGPLSLALGLAGALLVVVALLGLSDAESGLAPGGARRQLGTALRLVALGLPLALAVFWLFPRLSTPLWGVPERSSATPGLSDEMGAGQWLDLLADDSPALRATFAGPEPAVSQMYWRGPTLTDYDGRTWTMARRQPPPAPDLVAHAAPAWDYEVVIEPTGRDLLVALDLPTALPDGVRGGRDYTLRSPRRLDSVSRWRLRSAPPLRFETDLPDTFRADALRVPAALNPRTRALARQWRAETPDDAALVARALAWIERDFAYTLDTPLPGRHAVDEFLFDRQAGFCEHFSSAFTVLMREAGIPARVVTGYVGGRRNAYGDYWLVRRMDAHAWSEVWLEGRGWVRVDPTAAVAPERIYDTLEDRLAAGRPGGARFAPIFDLGDWARRGWNDFVLGFDANRQQAMLERLGLARLGAAGLVALLAVAALLALGGMLWLIARSDRETDPLLRAWHRLGRRYARLGLARLPHEPASAWIVRIGPATGDSAALAALTRRFVAARYAPDPADPTLARDLRAHRPTAARAAKETSR